MIEVELHHTFPDFTLDVHFASEAGMTVLFGPSGVGKTLTIRAIAGLFTPHRGYVRVQGETWLDTEKRICLPPQARRVGYVPQHYGLFPHMTVAENIAFGLRRLPKGEQTRRIQEMLQLMRLEKLANRRPDDLSGGQQQRVALARALVIRPRVLLLDEALGALDPALREDLQETVRLIHRTYNVPTLVITHDLMEASVLGDTWVVFETGRVVQIGTPTDIFHHPATPLVARAVGMRNIYDGIVQEHGDEYTKLRWAGGTIRVPPLPTPSRRKVVFGFRPEEVVFIREHRPLSALHNIFPVRVETCRPIGVDCWVRAHLARAPETLVFIRAPRFLLEDLDIHPRGEYRILVRQRIIHVFEAEG